MSKGKGMPRCKEYPQDATKRCHSEPATYCGWHATVQAILHNYARTTMEGTHGGL